jgi:hypothetical protein
MGIIQVSEDDLFNSPQESLVRYPEFLRVFLLGCVSHHSPNLYQPSAGSPYILPAQEKVLPARGGLPVLL